MRRTLLVLIGLAIVPAACKDSPTEPSNPSKNYNVGEHHAFNVNASSACEDPDYRTGRVVAVTQRAIVIADTANPRGAGTYTDQEYADFGRVFDEVVWPTITHNFGAPHDVDGNGRVILFFTRAVNELTPRGQRWYVGGFFFSRDLFPKRENRDFRACESSNEAEILYMLVPDPQGVVNGNARTKANELRGTVPVIAHELQHLVNASRRLFVVRAGGTGWQEETWLNEGLSHIAEELIGYSTSSLETRQNIDAARLSASTSERAAFLEFQYPNANRYAMYLENPAANSLLGPDSLSTRGATWSFLRYAADRKAGDEAALWRNLVTTREAGTTNLRTVLGAEPVDWIHDWAVSIAADDMVSGLPAQFQQASWNFRSVYPWVRDGQGRQLHPRYPLQVHPLVSGVQRQVGVAGVSAAYFTFRVEAGAVAELRTGNSTSSCNAGSALSLAVGSVHTVGSDGTTTICVNGGAQGGEFVLIPFSTSTGPGERTFSIRANSVVEPVVLSRSADPIGVARLGVQGSFGQESHAETGSHWEAELREREARELGPRVRTAGPALQPTTSVAPSASAANTAFRITVVRLH